jgi:hypothetical protein
MNNKILAALLIVCVVSVLAITSEARKQKYPIGDINQDCIVNTNDLNLVKEFYGQNRGDPRYIPCIDINGNGKIDIYDLAMVGKHYGEVC